MLHWSGFVNSAGSWVMIFSGLAAIGRTHLEIIGALKNIGSHATNIARIMLKEKPNGSESSNRNQLERNSQG